MLLEKEKWTKERSSFLSFKDSSVYEIPAILKTRHHKSMSMDLALTFLN